MLALGVGLLVGVLAPLPGGGSAQSGTQIPLVLCVPFGLLLLSIAVLPLAARRFWHKHYPEVALALGGLVAGYYLTGFGAGAPGQARGGHAELAHTVEEYVGFIALVGGLYVVSGGVVIRVTGRGGPLVNTLMLACGAVLANLVGTTGASVLLIRPFMSINGGRLRPLHVVFFIFIVSNCGGCLTPIGDPPLYLGYLKGVPFFWTLHLWPMWLLVNGVLLAIFFIVDCSRAAPRPGGGHSAVPAHPGGFSVRIEGWGSIGLLLLLVAGVFITPLLKHFTGYASALPAAAFQVACAGVAFLCAPRAAHDANGFTFEPVKEVALLFLGIFLTMTPALGYLQHNGSRLGIDSGTGFYFATGGLSALLDNAPTYLSFLQVALAQAGLPMNPDGVNSFLLGASSLATDGGAAAGNGARTLANISLGAVFFGAMTYIGNGPNFMVKAIAESRGVRMPSFVGYALYAAVFLLPVLMLNWWVFVR